MSDDVDALRRELLVAALHGHVTLDADRLADDDYVRAKHESMRTMAGVVERLRRLGSPEMLDLTKVANELGVKKRR